MAVDTSFSLSGETAKTTPVEIFFAKLRNTSICFENKFKPHHDNLETNWQDNKNTPKISELWSKTCKNFVKLETILVVNLNVPFRWLFTVFGPVEENLASWPLAVRSFSKSSLSIFSKLCFIKNSGVFVVFFHTPVCLQLSLLALCHDPSTAVVGKIHLQFSIKL